MRNHFPRPPVPRWQTLSAYGLLLSVPFLCVGVCLLGLTKAQQNISLGLVAGIALSVVIWMFRKLPPEHIAGREKKITKPQRVTAGQALFRCVSFSLPLLLYIVSTIFIITKQGLLSASLSQVMAFLLSAPVFILGAVQNYRLYKKARREGPLVIMPSSLPPNELNNLRSSKSVASLTHAIPESLLAKADNSAAEAPIYSQDAVSSSTSPHREPAAQQILTNNR